MIIENDDGETVRPAPPEEDYCDECGNDYPPEASSLEGPWHKESCSLYAAEGVVHQEPRPTGEVGETY